MKANKRPATGQFESRKALTKLHVSQLQLGMYVSRLDRPWLETPFLMQGFVIESLDEIDTIASYCEHVWIDQVVEEWEEKSDHAAPSTRTRRRDVIRNIPSRKQINNSRGVFKDAYKTTQSIMGNIRLGLAIDTDQAKSTVHECVQEIMRDPATMLLVSNMREKDNYTAEHSLTVCILAIAFGRHLGFNEAELNNIGLCGLLHDIGKMNVPEEILNKEGSLEDDEWEIMKDHATIGRNILMSTKGIYHGAIDVAYAHHEKLDGTGYPRGLKAAGISHYAKIIAICDAYDAMTSHRCYKQAIPSTSALRILYNDRDTHFDRHLVDKFMAMIGLYPPGSIVELVNGQAGIVIASNHRYRHLPKVIVLRDEQKAPIKEKVLNLADTEKGRLDKSYLIQAAHPDGEFGLCLKDYEEKGLVLSVR